MIYQDVEAIKEEVEEEEADSASSMLDKTGSL